MCGFGGLGMSDNPDNNDDDKSKNSFKEGLANLMTPNDGFSYKSGILTADNDKASYGKAAENVGPENSVSVSDGKGNSFSVDRDVTKGYNQGLVGSMLAGVLTGGPLGAVTGVASNAARTAVTSAFTDKDGKFSLPNAQLSDAQKSAIAEQQAQNDQYGGNAPDPVADEDDPRVKPTVPTTPGGIGDISDMSKAAAEGAFQAIPNPDYDPDDPMSPKFLTNPTYEQLFNYQQMQLGKPVPAAPLQPVPFRNGGLAQFAEGGELVTASEGGNEKTMIDAAVSAVKGDMSQEQASIVLGQFLANYGEEALRDLVEKVKSGEYDDTVDRFANGEAGEVNGPGDGSGVDDKVPASLEGQQDVLLADGEFVLRKKTADALEKKYGGGFLDTINEAENDAPRVIRELAARTA